jgi:hypothetical protein
MADAIFEALRVLADIDADHMHAVNDPLNPRHREAVRCYSELADYVCIELSRHGSCDYYTGKGAPPPPALIETRPGFKPP